MAFYEYGFTRGLTMVQLGKAKGQWPSLMALSRMNTKPGVLNCIDAQPVQNCVECNGAILWKHWFSKKFVNKYGESET